MEGDSLAEQARALVADGSIGTLSTHSRKQAGFPFGSVMPYAADGQGRPVFFISSLAMHTQNLRQDPRASLLVVAQVDELRDPLAAARVTLVGMVIDVAASEVRELYLARHPNSRQWQEFGDFGYFRLEVSAVYFVGGFGVMGWIGAEDYLNADAPR